MEDLSGFKDHMSNQWQNGERNPCQSNVITISQQRAVEFHETCVSSAPKYCCTFTTRMIVRSSLGAVIQIKWLTVTWLILKSHI